MANQRANQAPIPVEQFKLRLTIWREVIPVYEGGKKLLSHFLQTCDRFAANLATNDDAINEALFALIKAKIRGEALDFIVTSNPATWAACKDLLISRYSNPSSEDLLFNRLSTCHQRQNQTYEKYADEIKYHEQQAAFLDFVRQRANKSKSNIFSTTENSRKINPFGAPGTLLIIRL